MKTKIKRDLTVIFMKEKLLSWHNSDDKCFEKYAMFSKNYRLIDKRNGSSGNCSLVFSHNLARNP